MFVQSKVLLSLVALLGLTYVPAQAQERKDGTAFLRFVEEGKDGGRLETAVATYQNDKGQTVQLVAAVHIADTAYYKQLNKLFEGYDALLYEMVKPKDMGAPMKGARGSSVNWVRMLQKGLKTFLELDYQLDGIDYSRKNFVHADLTAEEFEKLQSERGESIMGMMIQTMMREMMKGDRGLKQEVDPMALLDALTRPDSARALKLILARQFQQMDEMVAAMEGPNGSVLLTERNKAAIKALKSELDAGKKKLGVFYGAAHMKDLENRLINDMGFKRTGVEYKIAWDLTPAGAAKNAVQPGPNAADDRDAEMKRMQQRIDDLEKKLREMEKKQ